MKTLMSIRKKGRSTKNAYASTPRKGDVALELPSHYFKGFILLRRHPSQWPASVALNTSETAA